MSYLKQAAAIAGLTIVTATASAQTTGKNSIPNPLQTSNANQPQLSISNTGATSSASAVGIVPTTKGGEGGTIFPGVVVGVKNDIYTNNSTAQGGNATAAQPTLSGSVSTDGDFKVRINNGPMAGQTLTINPEKETFSVTTYPWDGPAETVSGKMTKPATVPAYLVGRLLEGNYVTKTGDVRATCEVTKDSYVSEGSKPVIKPEYISYSVNCKTQFGHASVRVTPYNDKGHYTYNTQSFINSDPETGKIINIETPWPQAAIAFTR